jgi:hypothetical protein
VSARVSVGTIYRVPSKPLDVLYRLARYDDVIDYTTGDLVHDVPQYDYISERGGAASSVPLPPEAEVIWTPPADEPEWEVYVCDDYGFCIDPENIEDTLSLIEDEQAIWAKYGDTIPSRIVAARGDGKPVPQHPGSDTLRFKGSHLVEDRIEFEIEDEYAPRALQLWRAAQGIAAALNQPAADTPSAAATEEGSTT